MAEVDTAQKAPQGLVVIGTFKGIKPAREFDRDDGTKGMTNPKVGIEDDEGNVFSVQVSGETLDALKREPRGRMLTLPVSARGPYGSRGPVRLTRRGDEAGGGESWD